MHLLIKPPDQLQSISKYPCLVYCTLNSLGTFPLDLLANASSAEYSKKLFKFPLRGYAPSSAIFPLASKYNFSRRISSISLSVRPLRTVAIQACSRTRHKTDASTSQTSLSSSHTGLKCNKSTEHMDTHMIPWQL